MASLSPTVRLLLRVLLSIYRAVALRCAWLHRLLTGLRGTPAEERTAAMRAAEEHAARAVQALHAKREKGEAMADVSLAATAGVTAADHERISKFCRVRLWGCG